jgi:hypothetical protein
VLNLENVMNTVQDQKLRASAAGGWFSCNVRMAGPAEDGKIYIYLNEVGNKFNCWFSADSRIAQDVLPVALAALLNRKIVTVALTSTAPYSEIQRFYINA